MRWVQVKEEDAKRLEAEEKDFPKNCYYEFDNNGKFCKYHIDSHNILENFVQPENKKYGGNKSVRWNGRPLMIVGQDKSTYHQYVFSTQNWKGPKGKTLMVPKSSGEIYMVSGFQS